MGGEIKKLKEAGKRSLWGYKGYIYDSIRKKWIKIYWLSSGRVSGFFYPPELDLVLVGGDPC